MFCGMIPLGAARALVERKEQEEFEKYCASLPVEKSEKARMERKAEQVAKQKIYEQRQHELRVAEAGKTEVIVKNYYGFY